MVDAPVLHRLLLALIILGLGFSLYSMAESLNSSVQTTCSVTSTVNCGNVSNSSYSHFGPVPAWSVGVGGFVLLLVLGILLMRTYDVRYLQLIVIFAVIGVGFACYFICTEIIIGSICPVCTGAHISGMAVLLVSVQLLRMRRDDELRKIEESKQKKGKKNRKERTEEE
jgi:uncharacterized membrane protein